MADLKMAHEYTSWAYAQEIPGAGRKFVLVALADRANADGYSFPGQKSLASMTGQSERTVREHLEWLEAEGFIRREERRRKDGTRTSDAYYLPPMDSTGNIRRLTSSGETRRLSEGQEDALQDEPNPPATTGSIRRLTSSGETRRLSEGQEDALQDEPNPPATTGSIRRLSEPRSTGRFRSGHRQISPVDTNEHSAPSSTTQTPDYQPADFAGHESFNHQYEPPPLLPQSLVTPDPKDEEEEVREDLEDTPLNLDAGAAALMTRGPARGQTDSHLPTLHPETFKRLIAFRRLHGKRATDEMFRTWSRQLLADIHQHDEPTVQAALDAAIGNFATLTYPWSFYRACLNQAPRASPTPPSNPEPALDPNLIDQLAANAKEGTL